MSSFTTAFPLPSPQVSHHRFLKQSSYAVFLAWVLPTARSSMHCHLMHLCPRVCRLECLVFIYRLREV